jgi:hypothetical protein
MDSKSLPDGRLISRLHGDSLQAALPRWYAIRLRITVRTTISFPNPEIYGQRGKRAAAVPEE